MNTPPSVIHGWKAMDLFYRVVNKNYLSNLGSCQNFCNASAEDCVHDLRDRLTTTESLSAAPCPWRSTSSSRWWWRRRRLRGCWSKPSRTQESVIWGLVYEMAKVEDLLKSMRSSRCALIANNSFKFVLVRIADTREELLENLGLAKLLLEVSPRPCLMPTRQRTWSWLIWQPAFLVTQKIQLMFSEKNMFMPYWCSIIQGSWLLICVWKDAPRVGVASVWPFPPTEFKICKEYLPPNQHTRCRHLRPNISPSCWYQSYFGLLLIFSCPEQLNRTHCPSLGSSVTTNNQSLHNTIEWP